jgi:hypothetical protein
LLISTSGNVFEVRDDGTQKEPDEIMSIEGIRRIAERVTCNIAVNSEGDLIIQMEEIRTVKTGIDDEIHSLLILGEDSLELLIGTEPPHIFKLKDERTQMIQSFEDLEVRDKWYTPWGGPPAVRSLAATTDDWVYADIHVGSIMRSKDRGESWEPVNPTLHRDVHQVNTTPASDTHVYAATYLAAYISLDRGDSWRHVAEDLDQRYGRAIIAHPGDPNIILTTVSDGPHGDNVHGQLYRTGDGGENWNK